MAKQPGIEPAGACDCAGRRTCIRRKPEQGVLHRVVREHLETFLAEARLRGGGEGLPRFVERELREFLSCGAMARGFARFRCDGCGREILVAFSCKGRGFCPSCCGRRMGEHAAHLAEGVLGGLPVRQWVLTLPHRLRYRMAYDHRLCRDVLGVFVRAVLGFEQRRARANGVRGRAGAVTAIQRCGSALNTNVHFHTLVAEGVFEELRDGSRVFVPDDDPPGDADVARVLAAARRRTVRLLRRRGIDLAGEYDDGEADPLLLECPVLAQVQGASVLGRVATGPRAGQRVMRLGSDPDAPVFTSAGPRHAHIEGFDLHAATAVRAEQRSRLERLCRYVLRPPVAQNALEVTPEGRVLLRLRRPWRDGTRALCFEPVEFLEKLAALVPRPRTNLLIYHGAFAPRGRFHSARAAGAAEMPAPGVPAQADDSVGASAGSAASPRRPDASSVTGQYVRPRHFAWADLLRRVFAIDILGCPECGGRLRLVATIDQRAVIEKILCHLGLPVDVPQPSAARTPEWLPGVRDWADQRDGSDTNWTH